MRLRAVATSSTFCFLAPKTPYSSLLCPPRRSAVAAPLSTVRAHHSLRRRHGLYASLNEPNDTTEAELLEVVALKESPIEIHGNTVTSMKKEPPNSTAESPLSPVFWTALFKNLPSQSILLLNMVAILWGSQHAVIKRVVEDSDASIFTLLRFGLAALLASPYTPGLASLLDNDDGDGDLEPSDKTTSSSVATTWRWGAEMGFWMFLGFSFQAIGLGLTTAQRSGFLLYLNVKFVPFLSRILFGREISNATWASAVVAFSGTALLAYGGGEGASLSLNAGDWWSVAAAAASAMFILRLEQASSEVTNAAQLNSACLWVVTLLAAVWTVGQNGGTVAELWQQVVTIVEQHPWEVIYLSGVTTAFANWIQTKAQRDVSAERASVIYSLDPVYGAAFSYWLLGETLGGVPGWIGAGMITLAAATNAFIDLSGNASVDIANEETLR